MEEETLKVINEKIRELLSDNENNLSIYRAIDLIRALNNPLNG